MAYLIRRLVSTNKRRYQERGYDLDLSYITPRIIAMGFPCDGVSRLYRNPMSDVIGLLEERHAGHYKVYNLCAERGYDSRVFKGRVLRVPMYDGQAPPLHLMVEVCRDAAAWLATDAKNVVAVHCKAGKGRTGAVVCALMMALDPELSPDSLTRTLALWADRRTKDGKGVTIPSQRRYVGYFHQLLLTACTSGNPAVGSPTASAAAGYPAQQATTVDRVNSANKATPNSCCADRLGADDGLNIRESSTTVGAGAGGGQANGALRCPGGRLTSQAPDSAAQRTARRGADGADLVAGNVSGSASSQVRCQTGAEAQPPARSNPSTLEVEPGPAAPRCVPSLLAGVLVPQRCVKIMRLRFKGLPESLLRDCTASVWWRPVGHYGAMPVCHAQTRSPGACTGFAAVSSSGASSGARGAAWIIRPAEIHTNGAAGPELCLDLTGLPPLPPPSPPPPLPYYTPSLPPPQSNGLAAADGLAGPEIKTDQKADAVASCNSLEADAKSGPPVVFGDIKIQVFRGAVASPRHDVFKGKVTQFSAWICTSYLDPTAGSLELSRAELDKINKQLRRWPGALGVVLDYVAVQG